MLHHVALEIRRDDVEPEAAFWALLGFEPVDVPETLAGRTTWVQRGEQQIHLLWDDDPTIPSAGHVAVIAPDYQRDTAALRAAGHDVQDRERHWGAPRCFAITPAGHHVEVMAWPPR